MNSFSKKKVKKVVCGWNHTLILVSPNFVYSTGVNKYGELGIRNFSMRKSFCLIEFLLGKNVIDIFAGGYHSWFLIDPVEPISQFDPPSPLANSVSDSFSDNESRLDKNTKSISQMRIESMRHTNRCQLTSEKQSIRLSDKNLKSHKNRSLLPGGIKSLRSSQDRNLSNGLILNPSDRKMKLGTFKDKTSNSKKASEQIKQQNASTNSQKFNNQFYEPYLDYKNLIDPEISNSINKKSLKKLEKSPIKTAKPSKNAPIIEEDLFQNNSKNTKNPFLENEKKPKHKIKTESAIEISRLKNTKGETPDFNGHRITKNSSKLLDQVYEKSIKVEHKENPKKESIKKFESLKQGNEKLKEYENRLRANQVKKHNEETETEYFLKNNLEMIGKPKTSENSNYFDNKISFGNNGKLVDKNEKNSWKSQKNNDGQKMEKGKLRENESNGNKEKPSNKNENSDMERAYDFTQNEVQINKKNVPSNKGIHAYKNDKKFEINLTQINAKSDIRNDYSATEIGKQKSDGTYEHELSLNNDRNFYLLFCKLDYCHRFAIIISEKSKSNILKQRINEYINELKIEDPKISLWNFVTSDEFKLKKTNAFVESIISQNEDSGSNSHVLMMISSSERFQTERHLLEPTDYKKFNPSKSENGDIYSFSEIDMDGDKKLKILGYWYFKLNGCLKGIAESIEYMELRSSSYQ